MPPMWNTREPWTAPAYICQALRSKGYRVQFLDYNIDLHGLCSKLGYGYLWNNYSFFSTWETGAMDYLAHALDIECIEADVVGISVTHTSISFGVALARRIRSRFPRKKILFGGGPLYFPWEVAAIPTAVADGICKGEGEHAICEVMELGVDRIAQVPGWYVPDETGWRLTAERPPVMDLDTVAWPKFEGIDLDLYGKHFLPLMGSRGCIGRCLFCPDRYRMPGFRTRSAANQVDELEYLSTHFNVEHFPYNDPLLDGNMSVLEARTDEILRRGLKVQYGGNMMVRKELTQETFNRLRQSGMSVALVGVESGCAETLIGMRKRHTPELAENFIRMCHQAGIKTELNFILGFPTETEAHFQETCDFVRRNRPNIDAIVSIMPLWLFHSDLYDRREEFNIELGAKHEASEWYIRDGSNTLEIRNDRVNRFYAMVAELGLLAENTMVDDASGPQQQVPTDTQFYYALAAYLRDHPGGDTDKGSPRNAMTTAARQLAIHLGIGGGLPRQVIRLTEKAITSLRKRGLAQSIKRGKEWLQIHSGMNRNS
jgi:radical SAM superfamily enzyme YgiQ (UPF0313 family)